MDLARLLGAADCRNWFSKAGALGEICHEFRYRGIFPIPTRHQETSITALSIVLTIF
jgi:hypothetical protein